MMWNVINQITLSFLLIGTTLAGTELQPWTETDLELYPRVDYRYQHYNTIHSSSGSKHRSANDHFFSLGMAGSYASWNAEIEMILANTRHVSFALDDVRLTGRYQFFNDIVGDPVSVMVGVTLIKATKTALKDLSSFHHGRNEMEAHVSIGKEFSCLSEWTSRLWGTLIYGHGDHGSPWFRTLVAWDKNLRCCITSRVYLAGRYGCGGRSLSLDESFGGYGSIRHRSLDIGATIKKATDCWGIFTLGAAYRVYAENFPQCASQVRFSYIYPFSF